MTHRHLLFLLVLFGCCYGDENDVISHLILLDQVPATISSNATPDIIIRTNYSGQIEFQEAEKFKVLLNITAPSITDAYAVSSELIDNNGRLLLQVYEKRAIHTTVSLRWILLLIAGFSTVVFLFTILYTTWWYSHKKHLGIFGTQAYLANRHMYRSRNSMQLGAAAELMGEQDDDDLDVDEETERRKMEKLRVFIKPETIIEESEDSCDDDRTNPKLRFQVPVNHIHRSLRLGHSQLSNENVNGSGILDYPDQSADELENDLSPDQKVADADGSYTPLDDLGDVWHENVVHSSQSTAKLANPRGNLDYNIQTSKSDGDLLGDNRKMSEKEKVIIPPIKLLPPKQTRSRGIAVPKRAEPNIYQRGLNLRQHENDLSSSPGRRDQIRAQVHSPEPSYVNSSFGHYIELKNPEQMSKSRISRESNDAYELYTYSADIPMSTFKAANSSPISESLIYKVPKKPKPVFESGSPTNFDFNKLDLKVKLNDASEPYSPGKFSMLSEGSSSEDFSDNAQDDGDFLRLDDSDLDLPSPDHHGDGDELSNGSLPLPSPPLSNQFMPYDTHGRISQLSPRQSLVTPSDSKAYGTVIAFTGSPSPGGPFSKNSTDNDRFVFPPPPSMYNPPQHGAWARKELAFPGEEAEGEYVGLPMNLGAPPQGQAPPPMGQPPQPQQQQYYQDNRRDDDVIPEHKRSWGNRERRQSGGERDQRPGRPARERHQSGSDREMNYSGPDREMNYSGPDRERNYSGPDRERNYSGPDRERNYSGPDRKRQPSRPDRERNYSGPDRKRQPSGPDRAMNYSGPDRKRQPSGPDREMNYSGPDRKRQPSGADRERKESESDRERKPTYGKKGGKLHLQLTMLTTVCVLGIISGVYCVATSKDTKVNIVVYVPASFPYKNSTIYTASAKRVKVLNSKGMNWFVSPNPILHKHNSTWECEKMKCEHRCDDNTGDCICRHGYNMEHGKCTDINECQTGMIQCPHPQAGCANVDGTYECLCMSTSNLYKYEDLCLDCRDPCPRGKYEIQPCSQSSKKICKECTKSCGEKYYMQHACTEKYDATCLECHGSCNSDIQFEFSQCSDTQNRECKDKNLLPRPAMSSNVILDDLAAPNDDPKQIPYQPLSGEYPGFLLERGDNGFGSQFRIQARVREFQSVVLFRPVDHSDDTSPSDFAGNKIIIDNYCPYPLPYIYNLKYIKHNNVVYKGGIHDGMDTIQPCDSGSFTGVSGTGEQSILCSEPGVLSDVFQEINPEDYKTTKTGWMEKNKRCGVRHEACENCSRSCILQMNTNRNCMVMAADDTGKSPRISTCVSCCTRDNCSSLCRDYHNDGCSMMRCQNGSLVEFELSPVYPSGDDYYCHIEPFLDQRLLVIEYEVKLAKNSETTLFEGNLTLYTDVNWQKTGNIERTDSIIYVEINSQLEDIPNIVKGTMGNIRVEAGIYNVHGESLLGTVTSNNNISIKPNTPFGISPKRFGMQRCTDNTMGWENVVTSRNEGIVNISNDLLSMYKGNSTYLISNKSKAILKIGLNKNISLLKAVLKPAHLFRKSLSALMTMNGTHWIIVMKGKIENCPGVFSLALFDPNYLQTPIYHLDVGIECPRRFGINFTIPTGDTRALSKDMQLQVQDTQGTFILRIHTVGKPDTFAFKSAREPLSTTMQPQTLTTQDEGMPTHFSPLFIAVVAGASILLLFLLIFGFAWKQGIPEGDIQRFRIRHLILFVVYITSQFIYATLVSMTVFGLIIIAMNGDTSSFLMQYNQQRSVTTALSQLELDTMDLHLRSELNRQNTEASKRKRDCHETIQSVITDVQELQNSIEAKTINKIQKQSIKKLITDHTEATFHEFSQNMLKFRDSYRNYEQYVLHKLNSELQSTYQSIESSKWLRGAEYLYRIVANKKNLMSPGSNMVPFMSWMNMETDMMDLAEGLQLSLPDLPDLKSDHSITTTRRDRETRARTLSQKPTLSSQTINKWFIQPDLHPNTNNKTLPKTQEKIKKVSTVDPQSYYIFLVFMVIIDIFWLLHRMIKACGIGQLLLYGYPLYVDAREKKEGPNNEEVKKINNKSCLSKCRGILNKVLSTLFIPKLIGTVFVCVMVYFVSVCAYKYINRETFTYLGYHNDMEDVMRINEAVINRRLTSHAERINNLEYKMYEDAMNINIENHQYVLNLVETQWKTIEKSHTGAYCTYLGRIDVTASCRTDSLDGTLADVRPDRCTFPPVIPGLYERNETSSSKIAGMQLDGFLMNVRKLISDTCYIIIIYLSGVIIKELLGTVLWIYIKRSGFVSLRIIYETDEAPGSSNSSTTNK